MILTPRRCKFDILIPLIDTTHSSHVNLFGDTPNSSPEDLNMTTSDTNSNSSSKSSPLIHRITISEAVTKFEKSPSAIRRLIDKRIIKSSKDDKGKILIDEMELHAYLANSSPVRLPANESKIHGASAHLSDKLAGNQPNYIIEELYGEMLRREKEINLQLQHNIDEIKRDLNEERKRNQELQKDLMSLTKEMQAILNKESGLTSWIRTLRK